VRNNLILLAVLSCLLFISNKFFKDSYETKLTDSNLKIDRQFDRLILPNITIVRNQKLYFLNKGLYPIDTQLFDTVIDYLQKLIKESEVKANEINADFEKTYFESSINFKTLYANKLTEYIVGKLNPYTGRIALKIIKGNDIRVFFLRDDNVTPKVYKTLLQAASSKYAVLKHFLQLSKKQIFNKTIFSQTALKETQVITFKNSLRPLFNIEIDTKKTYPMAPIGVEYQEDKIQNITKYLENIKADDIFPIAAKEVLKKYLGQIILERENGKRFEVSLYQGMGKNPGHYVHASYLQFIYKLRALDKKLFFMNKADFWVLNWKLPKLDKGILMQDTTQKFSYIFDNSLLSQWLKQLATLGIRASELIAADDKFRRPSSKSYILSFIKKTVEYRVYFDRLNWFVFDPRVDQYYVFDKSDFPPKFEQKLFMKNQD
jgi:hypothetical protein